MQTRALFPLWTAVLHDLRRLAGLVPADRLAARLPGAALDLGGLLRRAIADLEHARQAVLEPEVTYREPSAADCPDASAIAQRLDAAAAALDELLGGSRVDALIERPARAAWPAKNALEVLAIAYLRLAALRAEAAATLRAAGIEPGPGPAGTGA